MKKKIALLLAVVMTLALLPTNVFAASTTTVKHRANSSGSQTLLIEYDASIPSGTIGYGATEVVSDILDSADRVRTAPELLVDFRDGVTTGDQFYVDLSGGEWAMKDAFNDRNKGNGGKFINYTGSVGTAGNYYMINLNNGDYADSTKVEAIYSGTNVISYGVYARKGSLDYQYNSADFAGLGISGPESYFGIGFSGSINDEIDANGANNADVLPKYGNTRDQLPYTMHFTSDTRAIVTVLASADPASTGNSAVAVIPLPMIVGENATINATITARTNSTNISSSAPLRVVEGTSSAVSISLESNITNYELFPITEVKVQELRVSSVAGSGTFSISAPTGFEFVNPSDNAYSSYVTTNSINTWVWNNSVTKAQADANPTWVGNSSRGRYVSGWVWSTGTDNFSNTLDSNWPDRSERNVGNTLVGYYDYSYLWNYLSNINYTYNYTDYKYLLGRVGDVFVGAGFEGSSPIITEMYFKATRNGDIDKTKVFISYADLDPSTIERGLVEFRNLGLLLKADESAPMGDVLVNIKEETDCNIEQSSVKAGTRANWGINFRTTTDIPTLYSGQYEGDGKSDAWHKVANMRFDETLPSSWLSNRKTEFIFPEGVKITKVDFSDVDHIVDEDGTVRSSLDAVYEAGATSEGNTYLKKGYVTIEDNVLSLSGIPLKSTTTNDRAGFKMEVWVTVEAGFEGPINVTLAGTAISDTLEPLKVADAENPIAIEVDQVTDIKIGYQYQSTSDFRITEAKAGILRKGDTVKVSISDGVDVTDMSFVDAIANVVEGGNLAIKNFKVSAYSNSQASSATLATNASGTISFDIDKASSVASTIEFTGVQVKIDRTIPETNYTPYKLVVWGNAVANNYDATSNPKVASFTTPGIMADYLKVATLASGNAMNSKVEVTIGTSSIKVNGVDNAIDAPAFIDPTSDSTMIPVRAVAVALGISDEFVQWDDTTKTVTIYGDTRVVQFTIGSDQIIVNGVASPMSTADGRSIRAQINSDRSFIPFRALGNAFNVPVDWNAETQTAIFNP